MDKKSNKKESIKESGFFKPYEKYSNVLRTWLVSYGVGAIAFLASQKAIVEALKGNSDAQKITLLFIVGIGLQVFGALLYKYTMGTIYHQELGMVSTTSIRYKFFNFISESLSIEFVIDALTIYTYVHASYLLVNIVIS